MHCVNTIAEIGFILFTQLYLKWRPGKAYFMLGKKRSSKCLCKSYFIKRGICEVYVRVLPRNNKCVYVVVIKKQSL